MGTVHKREIVGAIAISVAIAVGAKPSVCTAQRAPLRVAGNPQTQATVIARPTMVAGQVDRLVARQPQPGAADIQDHRPSARPGASRPASRPAFAAPLWFPAKALPPLIVNTQPVPPQKPALSRQGVVNRNPVTRPVNARPSVTVTRPGAAGAPIARPSSGIISATRSPADGGRHDSSRLIPALTPLVPNSSLSRDAAPANATAKYVQPKGPLTITSQHVYTSHSGLFLRKNATTQDGEQFVTFERLTDEQMKQFAKDTEWANRKYWRMQFIADKLQLPDQKVTILDPQSPFYFKPGVTADPGHAASPWMPASAPEAKSDLAWAAANDARWYADYRRRVDSNPAAADPAAGNGVPAHHQEGGKGNHASGLDSGGPPAGSSKPDSSGIAGHPGEEPGSSSGSHERPEDMGPMPPAGTTTVEVENEYGPPAEDAPKSSWGGISDKDYETFRACMVYGCSGILNGGKNPGATGGVQGNADQENSDGGTAGASQDDTGSDDDSSNSGDDDEDDNNNSSSGSDDGADSSESGYTPGADASGGSHPSGAEELKYSLFQKLGYLFHSRNFGPRFPLVGDPRPERGGAAGDTQGGHGTAQLAGSPGQHPKTPPSAGKNVLVNGDLRKKTGPAGPDKASAEDGFSDQFLRTFEVIDPVPIDK